MSSQHKKNTDQLSVAETARRARAAACLLATVPGAVRDAALRAAAAALEGHTSEILHANQLDCDDAAHHVAASQMSRALFKRLQTNEHGIAPIARSVREMAPLPDPLA